VVSIAVRLRHSSTFKEDVDLKLETLLGNKLCEIQWPEPPALYIRGRAVHMIAKVVLPTDIAGPFVTMSINFQDIGTSNVFISPLSAPCYL
jgi:hypothetical protein